MTIPKEARGNMFVVLNGKLLDSAYGCVYDLMKAKTGIFKPPDDLVNLAVTPGFPPMEQPVGLGTSFLVRGMSLPRLAELKGVIPAHWSVIDTSDQFLESFEIGLKFDKDKQVLSVTSVSGDQVRFRHDGLTNDFNPGIRFAIACLAVLPSEYWDDIQNKGLVTGVLNGDYLDNRWSGKGYLFVNDKEDPTFTYQHHDEVLSMVLPSMLPLMINRNSKLQERLQKMRPIGIFADLRTAYNKDNTG